MIKISILLLNIILISFLGCQNIDDINTQMKKIEVPTKACSSSRDNISRDDDILPFLYSTSKKDAIDSLVYIMSTMDNVKVLEVKKDYINSEIVSPMFGFIGNVKFIFDDIDNKIKVKSVARTGFLNLGKNLKTIEIIRNKYNNSRPRHG